MEDFKEWFVSVSYSWHGKNINYIGVAKDLSQFAEQWKNEEFLKGITNFPFSYRLNGFKKAGTEAFSIGFQLDYRIDTYWYGFALDNYNNQQPFIKKLYHEQLTPKDIEGIVEIVYNLMMDNMGFQIDRLNSEK